MKSKLLGLGARQQNQSADWSGESWVTLPPSLACLLELLVASTCFIRF